MTAGKCRAGLHWMTDANTLVVKQSNRTPGASPITYVCRACRRKAESIRNKKNRPQKYEQWKAARAKARAQGLAPDDPRHGSKSGWEYWGCDCPDCTQAKTDYWRLRRLKKKAVKMGIKLPSDKRQVGQVSSLDAVAEARFGMDRVMTGSVWDDPVGDAATDNY